MVKVLHLIGGLALLGAGAIALLIYLVNFNVWTEYGLENFESSSMHASISGIVIANIFVAIGLIAAGTLIFIESIRSE